MGASRRTVLGLTAAAAAALAAAPFVLRKDKPGNRFPGGREVTGAKPVELPGRAWEIIDPRFKGQNDDARLVRLWQGAAAGETTWLEGPVWMSDWGSLIFSDIPQNLALRFREADESVSVFQTDSGYANGHARDREGRLIAFEQDSGRVRRLERDGAWTVLADNFEGKRFNGPNDGAIHRDGSIWFTDPGYTAAGRERKHEPELPNRVYRIADDGKVTIAAEGPMRRPNGICFSPDFKRCYVVDSGISDGRHHPSNLIMFETGDSNLLNPRIFTDFAPGSGDGVRCDSGGNLWCAWGWGGEETNGVRVHAPDGDLLAVLHTPEAVSNLCFGGAKQSRLFITGATSLYAIDVNATGAPIA